MTRTPKPALSLWPAAAEAAEAPPVTMLSRTLTLSFDVAREADVGVGAARLLRLGERDVRQAP